MGRARWAPPRGSFPFRENGAWLSPTCLHSVATFHSGVQTVGGNFITETVPSTAGCHLAGTWEGPGLRRLGWVSSCSAHSRCGPRPLSLCRTTSPSRTSRTPAATPRPRRPPRPPRQHPRSLPAPRRRLPSTLPRSAPGSRRPSTCQVPQCLGRQEVLGSCQGHLGARLKACGVSLTCRTLATRDLTCF